jgi:hypothetical protein
MRTLFVFFVLLIATTLRAQDSAAPHDAPNAATQAAPEAVPQPAPDHPFDYDRAAPLDIKETGVEHRGKIAVHDISCASPKGGRVPAYLVVPQGPGPFAAIIWGH